MDDKDPRSPLMEVSNARVAFIIQIPKFPRKEIWIKQTEKEAVCPITD